MAGSLEWRHGALGHRLYGDSFVAFRSGENDGGFAATGTSKQLSDSSAVQKIKLETAKGDWTVEAIIDGKERAGIWAAEQVMDGMTVGLGTGSTAAYFVRALAKRIQGEGLKVRMVASSFSIVVLAEELGLQLLPLEQVDKIDLYADGADEVDPQKRLIKGRGAAMVREKILTHLATRFLVLIEPVKCVERLGVRFPVPVETLPFAYKLVRHELTALGASSVTLRMATEKDGPIWMRAFQNLWKWRGSNPCWMRSRVWSDTVFSRAMLRAAPWPLAMRPALKWCPDHEQSFAVAV